MTDAQVYYTFITEAQSLLHTLTAYPTARQVSGSPTFQSDVTASSRTKMLFEISRSTILTTLHHITEDR
jgi:hypothetical protein